MAASKQPPAVRITRPMSLFLDAVRFGAACAVLLHHAAFTKFGTYLPWTLTRTGIEPVIAFFVLSGFVIAYTAEVNDRSAYEYGLSRATRLLSVTIPAVALTVLLDGIGSSIAPKLYADHWSDSATLANLQMPPGVQVGLTVTFLNELWMLNVWPGTNSPFWSLGYEAAYYVLFGIAFYEGRKWPRIAGLILFSLLIGPKILLLLPLWLLGVAAWHLYKKVTLAPLEGAVLSAIATLIYVAFVASDARNALDRGTERLLLSLPASVYGMSIHFLSATVSGVLFAGIILGFKGLEGLFAPVLLRLAPWIRLLASCTFSMYLYHYPLIYFFRACASAVFGYEDIYVRSWFITAVVLTGTASSICALATFTERKKAAVRRMITMALVVFRIARIA